MYDVDLALATPRWYGGQTQSAEANRQTLDRVQAVSPQLILAVSGSAALVNARIIDIMIDQNSCQRLSRAAMRPAQLLLELH